MRAPRVLCLLAIFHTSFAFNYLRNGNYVSDRSLQWGPREKLGVPIRSLDRIVFGSVSRKKREDSFEEESTLSARHARHRRRRRCKNRPICSRNVATTGETQRLGSKTLVNEKDAKDTNDASVKIPLGFDDEAVTVSNMPFDENEASAILQFDPDLTNRKDTNGVRVSDIEIYDDRPLSDEKDFRDASSWMNVASENNDAVDENSRSSTYMGIDDQVAIHESLATLLTRLFQILRNTSIEDSQHLLRELNFVDGMDQDPCQKWLNSQDKLEEAFLGPLVNLPACPCQYPSSIFYDDKIWDEVQQRHFRWRDVSGESQRLDVYKPGASYCVRSLLTQGTGSAAAQHCCYDRRRRLLTRGSGAGTPNFVSPEISAVLHEKIDILPWRLCKGDFSRFNKVRPPNNGNSCQANPDDEEYQRQMDDTKYY